MRLYNFARLIRKYSADCQLVRIAAGSWAAGVYKDGGQTFEDIRGAVIPITEKRIQSSGGEYMQGDCELFTLTAIDLKKGDAFIVYKGKKYKLQESTDYSEYADFNVYVARRVSSFDTAGNNTAGNT